MLIEFTVGNFRSFKERETFSMVAANLTSPDPKLDIQNVIPIHKELRLLTSAAIYGRNASGKSNLITALRFMRDLVLNSSKDTQATDSIPVEPFLLSTETQKKPSFFEIALIIEGKQYRYGFEVDTQHVVSEWLFTVPTIREAMLFQREGNEIEVSSRFKEGRGLQERTRANALFLSVVAQFNGVIATEIMTGFSGLSLYGPEDWHNLYTSFNLLVHKRQREQIIALIRSFDLNISNIEIDQSNPPDLPGWVGEDWSEEAKHGYSAFLTAQQNSVKTIHPVYDSQNQSVSIESFDLDTQEAEGTKKLFTMAGPLVFALNHGNSFIVDEIDIKLHPLITRAIIALFNSKETNSKGAQVIFATHDANLLDNKLLRRDQIWFVDKDRYGASHLISLAEYRVRKDASFEKDYLQGRYGGVPSLGDLSGIFEETHA